MSRKLRVNDRVVVLVEYCLYHGVVLKVNSKTVKVSIPSGQSFCQAAYEKNFALAKVAHEDEPIAVIWELWKGVNGRGGYRLDRDMYPDRLMPAKTWPWQRYVYEAAYGQLSTPHNGPV